MIVDYIKNQIKDSIITKRKIYEDDALLQEMKAIAEAAIAQLKKGKKIMIAGNGGSAADAQHIAGELVNRFYFDRLGLPCIALTTDTSVLTAIGNDYGYEKVFSKQVEALGQNGDIFIGISTSGNSENIIKALEMCKSKGIMTIGLTGLSGGKMASLCDYCINIPSNETPRIQESHILVGHILSAIVEETLFGAGFS